MVKKSKKTTKTTIKAPTNIALLKKVATVSDSTKTLSKEIKSMTRIFAENQKVLVAMKNMMDSLATTMEQIQKQSKQINVIEEDTQRLYSGLNQVRGQSSIVAKLNSQTNKLQEQIKKIEEEQKSGLKADKIMQAVSESFDSIRNNSKMIMRISERIDSVKDDIKKVSEKAEIPISVPGLEEIKLNVQSISSRTGNLSGDITNLKNELNNIVAKAEALSNIGNRTEKIEKDVSGLAELLNRAEASTSEFHQKTNQIFQELQSIKNVTNKTSTDTSKEVIALLKLSEYQSNVRMTTETKYGEIKDLENMALQTAEIVNLFDKLSIESQEKLALPYEVRQWAVSKILDCADRWEIRFTDVLNLLINQLGRNILKESIRMRQVRDIFGIRAVDEIRQELGIQTPSETS